MATKKSTTKKAPAKKKSTVTSRKSKATSASFANGAIGLRPEQEQFMTFRITKQTVYWLVIGAVVILFTIWLMRLQADIQSLYDEVDANNAAAALQ